MVLVWGVGVNTNIMCFKTLTWNSTGKIKKANV